MFLAIAVDNLADAQSLTEIEEEKAEERERTRSIRRSRSKSPEKGDDKVSVDIFSPVFFWNIWLKNHKEPCLIISARMVKVTLLKRTFYSERN